MKGSVPCLLLDLPFDPLWLAVSALETDDLDPARTVFALTFGNAGGYVGLPA